MRVRTEQHDGLEFETPTWDPTPVPWNDNGAWAKDPEVTDRVLRGIRAAVPDHEALLVEASLASGNVSCATFWGSHGCSLTLGHSGLHVCGAGDPEGLCSAGLTYGDSNTLILWWRRDEGWDLSPLHWTWFA